MSEPIKRAGVWWTKSETGDWLRYDEASGDWQAAASPPPPPPPPPPVQTHDPEPVTAPTTDLYAVGEIGLTETDPGPPAPRITERVKFSGSWIAALAAAAFGAVLAAFVFGGGGSSVDPEQAFVPLVGYEYEEIPEEQMAEVQEMLDEDPLLSGSTHGFHARTVTRGGQPAAVAVAIAVDSDELSTMDRDAMIAGFTSTTGTSLERTDDLMGMETYEASLFGIGAVLFIDPAGLVVEVVGPDPQALKDVAKQLALGASTRDKEKV